ncbi:MAG: AcrR family transcriptional regulator [Planctomycetota bacterium]|jgi:AcrR family transcriptional regulator
MTRSSTPEGPFGALGPDIPAKQARSQRTAERIVAAAVELLGEQSFEGLGVAEIADRAGVSVGGFYARFKGKQALLQYLQGTVFDGILKRAHELFSPVATEGLCAADVIERYMAMAVDGFRRHRVVLQQVSLRSRTSGDPEFRSKVLGLNIELHDLFRARLYERLEQMQHTDPRSAIDVALTATSAVMREYVLFGDLRPQFPPIEDALLVSELTDLFCSYLRIDQ